MALTRSGGYHARQHEQRQQAALMMRRRAEGATITEIAEEWGCSRGLVHGRLELATREIMSESVEQWRATQNEQLDLIVDRLMPGVRRGDPQAVSAMLRALERRSRLNGLDMPDRVTVTMEAEPDVVPGELVEQADEAGARLRELPSAG